jgi:putative addiction module killer protein
MYRFAQVEGSLRRYIISRVRNSPRWLDRVNTTVYTPFVFELVKSATFDAWFGSLRDLRARARIAARLDRIADGTFGDVKPVGGGVSELRIDYGPGYRVYFMQRGAVLVVVLAGGDKRSQRTDIITARRVAAEWERGS